MHVRPPTLFQADCAAPARLRVVRSSNNVAVSQALNFSAIATTKNWFMIGQARNHAACVSRWHRRMAGDKRHTER